MAVINPLERKLTKRTSVHWLEAVPIPNAETITVARAYVQNWVARFGVPQHMTSDRGPQFVSELWTAMSNLLGTELHPTTAYHPQANGLIERNHRDVKAALKCRLTGPNWVDELPWVLLGLRTAPKEDLGSSSSELVYGSPLAVPGDFFPDSQPQSTSQELQRQRDRVGSLKPIPTSTHCSEHSRQPNVPGALKDAKFVFVRRDARKTPLQNPYDGPFEVIERAPKHFVLQLGNEQDSVSIDRLKPAYIDQTKPIQVAQPPRRGRPPGKTNPKPSGNGSLPPSAPKTPPTYAQTTSHTRNGSLPPSAPKTPPTDTKSLETPPTRPTYAEVTTRSGRTSKPPPRF